MSPATTKVTLAPNYRVQYVVKSSLTAIAAGSYVGSAAVPQHDGTLRALEVHIFPPGFTPGAGSRPYDLTPASTMTSGNVDRDLRGGRSLGDRQGREKTA
jgi:hypothetical protein